MHKITSFGFILLCIFTVQFFSQLDGANVPVFLGGDGLSKETAVIVNLDSETQGIRAEYLYLAKHFPDYNVKMQALVFGDDGNKYYDRMELESKDGKKKTLAIFFDITKFYGHFK